MSKQIKPSRTKTDITLEFYHKSAIYKSPITGAQVEIEIKKVEEYKYNSSSTNDFILVTTTHGVTYNLQDLTFHRPC
jgi:hypothetical protein